MADYTSTIPGAPTSGQYALGDTVTDSIGVVWVCVQAGIPGVFTPADVGPAMAQSAGLVNATTSTLAVTAATHSGKVVTLNRAAGIAVTLPAAAGTGANFRFFVGTTVTSNTTTIKVANASDTMVGTAVGLQDAGATLQGFEAGGTDDTITFNGTTTGGIKGDMVELIDVAANLWWVRVVSSGTGTEVTPFSATV